MRRPFTTQDAFAHGITKSALQYRLKMNRIQNLGRGVYLMGSNAPTAIERAAGAVVVTGGVACGTFAAALHGLDCNMLVPPFAATTLKSKHADACIADPPASAIQVVSGFPCTSGFQTLLDLAAVLNDLEWEQALESGLRKELLALEAINAALVARRRGNSRIRRVLKLRPLGAPPTESLLETLTVQLMRTKPILPVPTRQLEIFNRYDRFEARVDLAFPKQGVFSN